MKELKFRPLRADEVECRVAQVAKDGSWITALLYKDARCDMNILDETVGSMNWQRKHRRENANCVISIWDEEKNQWIEKEDTGTESNTEAQKGLASDSFKRSGFNWGIGRELYTAPLIFIQQVDKRDGKENYALKESNGKQQPQVMLEVTYMKVENGKITGLNIENVKKGHRSVFCWGNLNG